MTILAISGAFVFGTVEDSSIYTWRQRVDQRHVTHVTHDSTS